MILRVWYHREGVARIGEPTTVATDAELDAILDYVVSHDQPNPSVLVLKGRPLAGAQSLPDHQVEIGVDRAAGLGSSCSPVRPTWCPMRKSMIRTVVHG